MMTKLISVEAGRDADVDIEIDGDVHVGDEVSKPQEQEGSGSLPLLGSVFSAVGAAIQLLRIKLLGK